jgi:16S rRNA (guanine(966)-N(2))-methyltransferase RsmD
MEMFAGSGSVGFEALSRGASKIIFFENNPIAIQTLKNNSQIFPDENIEIIAGDSFKNLPNKINKIDEKIIIYIDPPFSIRKDMENIYKKVYDLFNKINDSKIEIAILEQLSDEVAPEILGNLINSKNKKFGKTTLRYFKKQ